MKIGDKVTCKTVTKNRNGFIVNNDPNITINKSYKIVKISKNMGSPDLKMLTIMGEKGLCNYWSDYFYTKQEERKLKLNKLSNVNKE